MSVGCYQKLQKILSWIYEGLYYEIGKLTKHDFVDDCNMSCFNVVVSHSNTMRGIPVYTGGNDETIGTNSRHRHREQ